MNKKLNRMARRLADHKRKGFTLVELVVVILIIAILAAAIFLGGATVIGQARERQVQSDLKNMASYVEDMLYSHPEMQYLDDYSYGEWYTYNTATAKFSGGTNVSGNTALTESDTLDMDVTGMEVMNVLDEYLTADFKLGDVNDAWDNPYCFSYQQIASAGSGKSSSCIIVINSLGENSLDESSDGNAEATQKVATVFDDKMLNDPASAQKAYSSATEYVESVDFPDTKDDYGVVIVMIDGAVSTAYYGF